MSNRTSSARFHINFAGKQIVGTKASYDKAGKGYGPIYDELVALMAKHPTFECAVVAPKEPAKPKQTYKGMNVDFMLDYASAVGEPKFRTMMEGVRDFAKKEKLSVYPLVKQMFLEHYAPKGRFAYAVAKERVRKFRYEGIIAKATTHIEPDDEGENTKPTKPDDEGENINALAKAS